MDTEKSKKSWEKFLTPETLRTNLVMASLYLSAFEILKSTVIQHIESFFTFKYVDGKSILDSEYQKVADLHKSPFQASLLWLEENGAITTQDIQMVDDIRHHRNDIAHKLPHFLTDINCNIDIQKFENIRYLLKKIGTWWIQQVEIPSNPDYDGIEVKDGEIEPGSVILLDILIQMGL